MSKPTRFPCWLRRLPCAIAVAAILATHGASAQHEATQNRQRLSREQVLRMTVQHNPTLHAAMLEVQQASENLRLEQGRNPYTLQVDGGLTRSSMPQAVGQRYDVSTNYSAELGAQLSRTFWNGTRGSVRVDHSTRLQTQPTDAGPTYNTAARATISHPFMRGSGTKIGEQRLRIARIQRSTADLTRARTASEIARDVLVAYWDLWYAEAAVNIEESARDLALRQRNEAKERAAEGALASVELLPFETRVAGLEESVISAHTDRRSKSLALSQHIGSEQALGTALFAQIASKPTVSPLPSRAMAIERALTQSPEIKELEGQLRLAQEQLNTSGDAYRPRLDLEGYVQIAGMGHEEISPMARQLGTFKATSVHIGLVYELPLDSSQKSAERAAQTAAFNVVKQRLIAARQRIQTQVDTLIEQENAARVRLELAEKTAEIAQKQVEAETERFQLGVAISVEVQQAEDEWRKARLRTERARVDVAQMEVRRAHATGQLLEQIRDWLST